jgi:hypothetical protein
MNKYTALFLIVLTPVVLILSATNVTFALSNDDTLAAAQYGPHRYNVYENTVNGTDIMFIESHDNGMTFSDPVNLSSYIQSPQLVVSSNKPQVGAFGNDVFVIWESLFASGIKNLFYTYSEDGGITFENATNVSFEEGNEGISVQQAVLNVNPINGTVYLSFLLEDGSVVPCHVKCDSGDEHIGIGSD